MHETGLIWDQGDGDLRAWPIPGTLKRLHNTTPPRGEVFMSMYTLDGAEMTSTRATPCSGRSGPLRPKACTPPVPSSLNSSSSTTNAGPTAGCAPRGT